MQKPYQNQKATVFRRYYSFVLSALCSIYLVSSLFCPLSTSAAVSTTTALDASKRISGGGMHSIILKANGEVLGWGRNQEGQCNIPPAAQSGVVAVSAGYAHSMALKADGTVIAWGSTAYNRCAVPADLNTAIAIAAGEAHSLALRSDGTIVGWGNTNAAALSNLPPGLNHVIAIASTYRHCLALKDDGTVVAWGENGDEQCNVPADLGPVVAIAAGSKHSLALKADGTVVAWGSNAHTQCDVPEGLSNVIAIAAGSEHSLALKADHSIIVWGATGAVRTVPVKARNDVIGIAAGGDEFCLALKNNGELIAWGYNYYHPCDVPAGLNMAGSLNSLTVNPGTLHPSFSPNTLNYTLDIPNSVANIELTAVLEESVNQQLYINDELQPNGVPKNIPLNVGTTTVSILTNITLEGAADPGGLTRHYNLGIHRAGPDNTNANLWNIMPDTGVLTPAFDPAITEYTVTVPNETTNVELTAIPADSTATVTINEHSGSAGLPYAQLISLEPNENPVNITVAAGDGNTTKTYQVTIIRGPSSNAGLAGLTVDAGTLTPAFENNTAAYRVENPGAVTSLAVTAALADPEANLTINGEAAEHNVAKTVPLTHGGNLIPLVVTSPNGLYEKAYVLSVNGTVNNANLATLSAQAVNSSDPEHPQELLLTFDPATTSYQLQVENAVESFELTATPSDDKALLLQGETILPSGEARSIALTEGVNEIRILVVAQDASTKAYTLEITRGSALELETTTLPLGVFNAPYATTLVAQGGTLPYTWSISGLPAGLSLNSASGAISGTPQTEGTFALTVTVTDALGLTDQTELSLQINQGCGNGGYLIAPLSSPAYTIGYTENGLPTMTVKDGISGFNRFSICITPVNGHGGVETAVLVHLRAGLQLSLNAFTADFDHEQAEQTIHAAFNVQPGDIIKTYLVDELGTNPTQNPLVL